MWCSPGGRTVGGMQTPSEVNTKFAPGSLAVATAITAAASVAAVVVVRAITLNLVTVPTAFTPLSNASTAIVLSILGVLALVPAAESSVRSAGADVPTGRADRARRLVPPRHRDLGDSRIPPFRDSVDRPPADGHARPRRRALPNLATPTRDRPPDRPRRAGTGLIDQGSIRQDPETRYSHNTHRRLAEGP
jgi:hypothetical protein